MRAIVWANDPAAVALAQRLASEVVCVRSAEEFLRTPRDRTTVLMVDGTSLRSIENYVGSQPVIAVCDGLVATAVDWFAERPWLSHVLSTAMLSHPLIDTHLRNLANALVAGNQLKLLDWLRSTSGRRIRLTDSSKCADRVDRAGEFFARNGLTSTAVELARDATGELLANAFYDAPAAAGTMPPIPRETQVLLPANRTCDLAYAVHGDYAVIRVLDRFGSLTRLHLLDALRSSALKTGGQLFGLPRVFAIASMIAISVVNHKTTEIFVAIGNAATPPAYAVDLFLKDLGGPVRRWRLRDLDEDTNMRSANHSVVIVDE